MNRNIKDRQKDVQMNRYIKDVQIDVQMNRNIEDRQIIRYIEGKQRRQEGWYVNKQIQLLDRYRLQMDR